VWQVNVMSVGQFCILLKSVGTLVYRDLVAECSLLNTLFLADVYYTCLIVS